MIAVFTAVVAGAVVFKGLLKGGFVGLTAFHLTANTYHWLNFGTTDLLSTQLAGLPFYLEHLGMLGCLVLVQQLALVSIQKGRVA